VGEDLPRGHDAAQLALVFLARVHELGGNDAVAQILLLPVDVEQEEVQGGDALHEAGLDPLPLLGGNDARHEVEREDALDALLLAVHREGDALVQEGEMLQALATLDLVGGERLQDGDDLLVVWAWAPRRRKGLVEALLGRLPADPAHQRLQKSP
jgi:hypothetical protein